MSNTTEPYLPGLEIIHARDSEVSAHYKGTWLCRNWGKEVEVRFKDSGFISIHLLTTAQAEQLRLDIERALERNAHAPFK